MHVGLAEVLLQSGDPTAAIVECSEVLKLRPGSVEAAVILGGAGCQRGNRRGDTAVEPRARQGPVERAGEIDDR